VCTISLILIKVRRIAMLLIPNEVFVQYIAHLDERLKTLPPPQPLLKQEGSLKPGIESPLLPLRRRSGGG
jgi:hypothetical protein